MTFDALLETVCLLLFNYAHLHLTFFPLASKHGRNLVRDTGNVCHPTFSDGVDIICHVSHFFLLRFCIWKGFQNKSDVCHVLFEELFMLDGRPHTAKLMLKSSLVWYHWILLVYKF